jgi:chemotaxis response regulator CheB
MIVYQGNPQRRHVAPLHRSHDGFVRIVRYSEHYRSGAPAGGAKGRAKAYVYGPWPGAFRTAACGYGPRVIGIVLSGALDDGTAGLVAIKAQGGLAIVQDPNDAIVGAMPRSALENVDIDHVLPAGELPKDG